MSVVVTLTRRGFLSHFIRSACSAAKSSTDNFTAPPPVTDHQTLHVMQP